MFVESFHDLWCLFWGGGYYISIAKAETNDLEAIMHARNEEVILTCFGWVPFDSPRATADVCLRERDKGLACVEEPDGVIVAADREEVLDERVALNGRHTCVESRDIDELLVWRFCVPP